MRLKTTGNWNPRSVHKHAKITNIVTNSLLYDEMLQKINTHTSYKTQLTWEDWNDTIHCWYTGGSETEIHCHYPQKHKLLKSSSGEEAAATLVP